MGLMNAAVWLGSAAFFSLVAGPALLSAEMKHLLGENNYPFFAGAIVQLLAKRFFKLQVAFAAIALTHMLAEWAYLGKPLRRANTILLCGLLVLSLACALVIGPKIQHLHRTKFAVNQPAEVVRANAKSLQLWQILGEAVNLVALAGVAVHFWRLASAPSQARFVVPVKFRI